MLASDSARRPQTHSLQAGNLWFQSEPKFKPLRGLEPAPDIENSEVLNPRQQWKPGYQRQSAWQPARISYELASMDHFTSEFPLNFFFRE